MENHMGTEKLDLNITVGPEKIELTKKTPVLA
jgi:hypothetical protein